MAAAVALTLGLLGTWRWASAVGPDVNDDGHVDTIDIVRVVQAFGQTVATPIPTATPTDTPTPTPTRIPGMLDVEVNLSVSENYHSTNDRQPFSMTVTMYNHGDNTLPENAYALIETRFKQGAFPSPRLEVLGGPHCPAGFGEGFVGGQDWIVSSLNHSGNRGLKTLDPGMSANDLGKAQYRLVCVYAGDWVDPGDLDPLTQSDTATITVSLRDETGAPLVDGNPANNVAVEIVELVVP